MSFITKKSIYIYIYNSKIIIIIPTRKLNRRTERKGRIRRRIGRSIWIKYYDEDTDIKIEEKEEGKR